MGSLPLQCNQIPSPTIKRQDLSILFNNQQHQINHFFNNLDLTQTQIFAQTLLDAKGAIFFSGIGKSGFIAQKLAQTLASLSFRSSFLSPVDALHGDIGAIFPSDILVIISKSGSSTEVLDLVPCAKAKGAFLIGVTCVRGSPLEKVCDMNVHLPVEEEVCPFGLAPVTSAGVQMLFGDTVAAGIMRVKGIGKEEFARNHPAGRIGKSLIFKVKDLMKKLEDLPLCKEGDMIMDKLTELNSKGCGCLLVINDENHLIGTFTDGDLRRTLKSYGEFIFKLTVGEICNRNPRTITAEAMAVEAMQKMELPPSAVQFLPVIDDHKFVIGIITLHGLVSVGL